MADELTLRRLAQALDELSQVQLELDHERVQRRDAQASLDELLWSMSDAVLLVDPRGLITRVNRAAVGLLGQAEDALRGTGLEAVLAEDVPATPWALLAAHPDGRFQAETSVDGTGGRSRAVSVSAAVVRSRSGMISGGVYALRDLTETQRLVHELEAAGARWRLLARVSDLLASAVDLRDALPDVADSIRSWAGGEVALVLVDEQVVTGVVTREGAPLQAALHPLMGRHVDSTGALGAVLDGASVVRVADVREDDAVLGVPVPGVRAALLVALAAREEVHGALVVLDERDGPIADDTVAVVEQLADRVALALASARLRDALAQLTSEQHARQAREDLLAGVSHDMKTPLVIIEGLVNHLARRGAGDASADPVVASLRRQTRRLRRLVLQFLDFVCLESGREVPLQLQPVDLGRVLDDSVATIDEGGRVQVRLPPGLPRVLADADRLDEILANLLTNALKFSPPDAPVTVEAAVAGGTVRVSVADRGPGIDPAEAQHVFAKFTRGAGAASTEGSGLGLYITHMLVTALGGHISVEARRGGGSRFVVSVPVVEEDTDAAARR